MDNFNTLKGHHFKIIDGVMCINKKEYTWHIPKTLRSANIKKGDLVLVSTSKGNEKVIVSKVYREDIEKTKKRYKFVQKKIDF